MFYVTFIKTVTQNKLDSVSATEQGLLKLVASHVFSFPVIQICHWEMKGDLARASDMQTSEVGIEKGYSQNASPEKQNLAPKLKNMKIFC